MRESNIRQWHRRMGIGLVLFIFLQTGSGLLISLGEFSPYHSHAHAETVASARAEENEEAIKHGVLGFVHHGGEAIGFVYRVLVGMGMIGMAFSGSVIFMKSRARFRKA